MITPCLPVCEPVRCDVLDYTGQAREAESYGRRKRETGLALMERIRRDAGPEEMLVVQTLKIVDKYGKKKAQRRLDDGRDEVEFGVPALGGGGGSGVSQDLAGGADCLNKTNMITGAVVFLLAQLLIVVLFAIIWRRSHNNDKDKALMLGPDSRTDSLSYIYETGHCRRLQ